MALPIASTNWYPARWIQVEDEKPLEGSQFYEIVLGRLESSTYRGSWLVSDTSLRNNDNGEHKNNSFISGIKPQETAEEIYNTVIGLYYNPMITALYA